MEDESPARITSRRRLIAGSGGVTLAGAALTLLSGCTGIAIGETKSSGAVDDAAIGLAAQHTFTGSALGTKWSDPNRRSAFFGTFSY